MSKFVGKFRKNKEYNENYSFTRGKHRNDRNDRVEIKKILTRHEEEVFENTEIDFKDQKRYSS